MDDETDLLQLYHAAGDTSGGQPISAVEPLLENHQRALAAQRSTILRIEEGHAQLRALAAKIFHEVETLVEETDARLSVMDPGSQHYRDLVAFADQFLGAVFTNALKMIGATGENVTNQSGDDVRDDGAGDEETIDRYFGATVLPPYGPVLQPRKGTDGTIAYHVVNPGGYHG